MLENNKLCNGCSACAMICPKNCIIMEENDEGFLYPNIDLTRCISCNACVKICPFKICKHETEEFELKAYGAYNIDNKVRLESSSGGIFTLLASEVLNKDGVVFGACFNENFEVVHDYIENMEDICKFRGSKYVQSKIGKSYKIVEGFLKKGRLVLFTGTPCQIGGLLLYLGKDYKNLITQDFICHGVTSPKAWKQYVNYREKCADTKVVNINFRNKNWGWNKSAVLFQFQNNIQYLKRASRDWWVRVFLYDLSLRESCYKCCYKDLHRKSDITLADFWGVEKILLDFNYNKGVSLVVINSSKGANLFDKISNHTCYKEVTLSEAISSNTSITESVTRPKERTEFYKDFTNLKFKKLIKKYYLMTILIRVKKYINRFK